MADSVAERESWLERAEEDRHGVAWRSIDIEWAQRRGVR